MKGLSPDDMAEILTELFIAPVITAHPTETKRRTILLQLKRIADLLDELAQSNLLPSEEEETSA